MVNPLRAIWSELDLPGTRQDALTSRIVNAVVGADNKIGKVPNSVTVPVNIKLPIYDMVRFAAINALSRGRFDKVCGASGTWSTCFLGQMKFGSDRFQTLRRADSIKLARSVPGYAGQFRKDGHRGWQCCGVVAGVVAIADDFF